MVPPPGAAGTSPELWRIAIAAIDVFGASMSLALCHVFPAAFANFWAYAMPRASSLAAVSTSIGLRWNSRFSRWQSVRSWK